MPDAVDGNHHDDKPAAATLYASVCPRAAKRLRQRERRRQKRHEMRDASQAATVTSTNMGVGSTKEKISSPQELNPLRDSENKPSCQKVVPKRNARASFRGVDLAGRVEVYSPAEETVGLLSMSSSTEEASEEMLSLPKGPRLSKASPREDVLSMRLSHSETSESFGEEGSTSEAPHTAFAAAFATGSVHCRSCEEAINCPRSFSLMQAMRAQLDSALADIDAGRNGDCRERLLGVIKLCSGLDPYLEMVHRPLSEPVRHLQQASHEVDWREKFRNGETKHLFDPGMSCSSMVIRTLQFVSHLVRANNCLQVGLSTGEAALAMAEVLPAQGRLLVLEEDRFFVNFAQRHFRKSPFGGRISIQCGNTVTLMKELQVGSNGGQFDIIFLDGNKSEYAAYLDLIVSRKLLVPGGIVVVDDVLWKGGVYDALPLEDHGTKCRTCWPQSPWPSKLPDPEVASVMAAMNDRMTQHAQLEPLVLPIHNGLSLLRYMPQEGMQETGRSLENNIHALETVLRQEGMPPKVPVTPEILPQDVGTDDAIDEFGGVFTLPERQFTAPAALNMHSRRSWSPHLQQQHECETPMQMWPATPDHSPPPSPRPQWLQIQFPTRQVPWF